MEQGVAVKRPAKPTPGWRSVATPDILKFKGKYYLYYQAFVEAPGTRGDYCPVGVAYSDSPDGPWLHSVITSYSIHYTKLYENGKYYVYYTKRQTSVKPVGGVWTSGYRITSYNVCYTKLLRSFSIQNILTNNRLYEHYESMSGFSFVKYKFGKYSMVSRSETTKNNRQIWL